MTNRVVYDKSPLAIMIGIGCFIGTIVTFFWPVLFYGQPITVNHLLILLSLAIGLGSGFFMWDAFKDKRHVSGIGFSLLFVAATTVCILIGMGQAMNVITKAEGAAVQASSARLNHDRQISEARINMEGMKEKSEAADKIASEREAKVDQACRNGETSTCRAARLSATTAKSDATQARLLFEGAEARYWALVAKLDDFKPLGSTNPELQVIKEIWHEVTGYDSKTIEKRLQLIWTGFLSFLTEIGTLNFLHYGFKGKRRLITIKTIDVTPKQIDYPPKQKTGMDVLLDIVNNSPEALTNDQLAKLMGEHKAVTSVRVKKAVENRLVRKRKVGKFVYIEKA